MGFFDKTLYKGVNRLFKPNTANPMQESREAIAARQGRAQNLTMAADNWLADPTRARQQQDFMSALRAQLADETNRGYADVARDTKFDVARQGLTGGRVDVDTQNRNLQDLFKRRLGNEMQVQDAGQQLRQQDLGTYQSMLDSAYGAADTGQDAWRNLIQRRSNNNQTIPALLHQHLGRTGNMWLNYYGGKVGPKAATEGANAAGGAT